MNYLYLNGPVVSSLTAPMLRADIRAVRDRDPAAPVTLVINSEGGDVYEGVAVYNMLRAEHVDVVVSGMAASIASLIVMAGSHVAMYSNSILFIHHAWSLCSGSASEFQDQADQLRSADRVLVDAYMAKSGRTEEEIFSIMDGPTGAGSSIDAARALELGLIDEVLDPMTAIAASLKRFSVTHHTIGVPAASADASTSHQESQCMSAPDTTHIDPAAECGTGKQAAEEVVKVEGEIEKKEEADPSETRISELEKKVEELSAKLEAAQAKLAAQAKFRAVTASAAQTAQDASLDWPELVKKIGFKAAAEQYPEVRRAYMKAQIAKGSIR